MSWHSQCFLTVFSLHYSTKHLFLRTPSRHLDVLVHTCNSSAWRCWPEDRERKVGLGYIVSWRPGWGNYVGYFIIYKPICFRFWEETRFTLPNNAICVSSGHLHSFLRLILMPLQYRFWAINDTATDYRVTSCAGYLPWKLHTSPTVSLGNGGVSTSSQCTNDSSLFPSGYRGRPH